MDTKETKQHTNENKINIESKEDKHEENLEINSNVEKEYHKATETFL